MNHPSWPHPVLCRLTTWLLVLLAGLFAVTLTVYADEADFICRKTDDGRTIVTGYTGSESVVECPLRYEGIVITLIGDNAFSDSKNMERFLPNRYITDMGAGAFAGCEKLEIFTVPDQVAVIQEGTFRHCISLFHVTLGEQTVTIAPFAFDGCTALQEVEINPLCREIGHDAFRDCPELSSILFRGSEEEWNRLTIAEGNDVLTHCRVTVNYGTDAAYLLGTAVSSAAPFPASSSDTASEALSDSFPSDDTVYTQPPVREKASYTKVDVSIISGRDKETLENIPSLIAIGGIVGGIILLIIISAVVSIIRKKRSSH